ncbi:MAG: hypothetical protein AAFY30_00105 [Cyanobacteria bacterium J06642_12]
MTSPSDTVHKHPRKSVSRAERLVRPRTAAIAETPLERACMQVADRLAVVEAEDELNIVSKVFDVLDRAQQELHVQRLNERIEKGKRLRSTVELYLKYAFSFAVIGLGAFLLRGGDAQIGYLLLGLGIGTICGSTIDLSEFS